MHTLMSLVDFLEHIYKQQVLRVWRCRAQPVQLHHNLRKPPDDICRGRAKHIPFAPLNIHLHNQVVARRMRILFEQAAQCFQIFPALISGHPQFGKMKLRVLPWQSIDRMVKQKHTNSARGNCFVPRHIIANAKTVGRSHIVLGKIVQHHIAAVKLPANAHVTAAGNVHGHKQGNNLGTALVDGRPAHFFRIYERIFQERVRPEQLLPQLSKHLPLILKLLALGLQDLVGSQQTPAKAQQRTQHCFHKPITLRLWAVPQTPGGRHAVHALHTSCLAQAWQRRAVRCMLCWPAS